MATQRLIAQVQRDFAPSEADTVLELLSELGDDEIDGQDPERIQAAIVLFAEGDSRRFLSALALAKLDWRDALVVGGLAHADWPERLDNALPYHPVHGADRG
jgi:hypothetical protein